MPAKNIINGNSELSLLGALYFPSQEVRINGTSDFDDGCLQIVANTVQFLGTTDINNDAATCANLGIAKSNEQLRTRLME